MEDDSQLPVLRPNILMFGTKTHTIEDIDTYEVDLQPPIPGYKNNQDAVDGARFPGYGNIESSNLLKIIIKIAFFIVDP